MIEVVKLFTSSKAETFQRSSSIANRARMNLAQSPCDVGLVRIEDDDLPAGRAGWRSIEIVRIWMRGQSWHLLAAQGDRRARLDEPMGRRFKQTRQDGAERSKFPARILCRTRLSRRTETLRQSATVRPFFVEMLTSERQTDPCDDRVPLTVFSGRIVDQDTVHVFVGPIASIVPGPAISNARYCEETWRDPLVLDPGWRLPFCEKSGR